MKLAKWFDKQPKRKTAKGMGFMLQINRREAYALIKSISAQLLKESPNAERAEFFTEEGEYFSVAVEPKD